MLLLPNKHKNGAHSFVLNGMFEIDPKAVPTACNNLFVKVGENLARLLRVAVKILCFTLECQCKYYILQKNFSK